MYDYIYIRISYLFLFIHIHYLNMFDIFKKVLLSVEMRRLAVTRCCQNGVQQANPRWPRVFHASAGLIGGER